MKKTCYVLLCALLLSLAPTAFAFDGDGSGVIGQLLDKLISFFVGPADEPEIGELSLPNSVSSPGSEAGNFFPPGG